MAKSLNDLQNPAWKVQKAGVTILSVLARTGMHQPPSCEFFLTFCDFRARRGGHRPPTTRDHRDASPDGLSADPPAAETCVRCNYLTGCVQANFVYAWTRMRAAYFVAEQQVLPAILRRRWN